MAIKLPEFLQKKRSLEEIEEENEKLQAADENWNLRLSIKQKQNLVKQLEAHGGNVNDFKEKGKGISFKKIYDWLTKFGST